MQFTEGHLLSWHGHLLHIKTLISAALLEYTMERSESINMNEATALFACLVLEAKLPERISFIYPHPSPAFSGVDLLFGWVIYLPTKPLLTIYYISGALILKKKSFFKASLSREVALWVSCLSYKHDLCSNSRTHVKMLGLEAHTCKPSAGNIETAGFLGLGDHPW